MFIQWEAVEHFLPFLQCLLSPRTICSEFYSQLDSPTWFTALWLPPFQDLSYRFSTLVWLKLYIFWQVSDTERCWTWLKWAIEQEKQTKVFTNTYPWLLSVLQHSYFFLPLGHLRVSAKLPKREFSNWMLMLCFQQPEMNSYVHHSQWKTSLRTPVQNCICIFT